MTRWSSVTVTSLFLAVAGCSSPAPGEPVIAAYTAPDAGTVTAVSLAAPKATRVAAISPDGQTAAVLITQRLCLVPTSQADKPEGGRCLSDKGIGRFGNLVSFSGNGATVMVMPDIQTLSDGPLYLVSTTTAKAIAVMPPASAAVTTSGSGTTPDSETGSLWRYGNWNDGTGRLIAISQPPSNTEATLVSDVDPVTGKVTALGPAADPGDSLAAGPVVSGSVLLYPVVTRSAGHRFDLNAFDLTTHKRRVLVDVKPVGAGTVRAVTNLLALSPDGTTALVSVRGEMKGAQHPAQLLDLATGVFSALAGDSLPQAGAFSPDGQLLALLLPKGQGSELAISRTRVPATGAKGTTEPTNRMVASVAGAQTTGLASMRWSRTNLLSVSSVNSSLEAELAGWSLR